jgi:hypothetical protein
MSGLVHRDAPPSADPAFSLDYPSVREAVNNLEAAIGGRPALVEALTVSPAHDPEADYLLGLIADPRNDDKNLSTLCYQASIPPAQLLRLYRTAVYAKAQVLAIHEVASAAQPVTRDVVRRAQNHYRICDSCHGAGCKSCHSTGQLLVDASFDHQKLTLDLLGLLPKGGPTMNLNQVTQTVAPGSVLPFATLQLAVQQILREEAADEVIDVAAASPPVVREEAADDVVAEATVVAPEPADS